MPAVSSERLLLLPTKLNGGIQLTPPPKTMPNRRHDGVCAAPNTACRNRTATLRFEGHDIRSPYCHYHTCRKIENGRACQVAKFPRAEVCPERESCLSYERSRRWGGADWLTGVLVGRYALHGGVE